MRKVLLSVIVLISIFVVGCSFNVIKIEDDTSIEAPENTDESTKEETSKEVISKDNTTKENEESTTEEETTKKPMASKTRAEDILDNMTLEEKVAQMFIGRCPEENATKLAKEYQIGGYILFARDFKDKTKNEVINNIKSYQEAAKIPMFIGVDEEGGTVNRVSRYKAFRAVPFWSPQALYKEGGMPLIVSDTIEKCTLLKSLGINLNFAPVADLSTFPSDFMYDRTFGLDATSTSQYVETVVENMRNEKMGSVIKHFPGYGNNEDTHTGVAYDSRSYESFVQSDFIPFKAGINKGVSMVLVAHNVVYCMDETYPASLSENVHKILREELGFDGVIITDDLSMEGAKAFAKNEDIAVLAIKAGNDLLCTTDFQTQINSVINALRNGVIKEERIDESVLRILQLKIDLEIIK